MFFYLTIDSLNIIICYTPPQFLSTCNNPVNCKLVLSIRIENSVDPDQIWSGSTVFPKMVKFEFSRTRVTIDSLNHFILTSFSFITQPKNTCFLLQIIKRILTHGQCRSRSAGFSRRSRLIWIYTIRKERFLMDQQDRNLHHFMQYCQPIIHLLTVMPSCHLIITTGEVNHVKRALTYILN